MKHCRGSPVKAEHLGQAKKRGCKCSSLEDSRPAGLRNMPGYNSRVRSLVLNYCANHSEDLCYLYKKADLQTAILDHDYCASPWTENWVDERKMVTDKDVEEIEKQTREQSKSRLWHKERAWRITASRFGDILNCTERRDKDKLCKSLLYTVDIDTPAVIHGKQYEAVAVQKLGECYCSKVWHVYFKRSPISSCLPRWPCWER